MKRIITIVLVCLSLQMSAQCWQSVSASLDHSLAIRTDGTLWAWGDNEFGELGDNTRVSKNIPTQIGTESNWSKVAAGSDFSLAIKTDGTLWAWGTNTGGVLGTGTTASFLSVPTQVGTATNWQSIVARFNHSLALKSDGSLWAWGKNANGQLGDNTTVDKSTPSQVGTATNWQSISGGYNSSMAIKTDGTLWTWGYNASGTLGDGTTTHRYTPTQIGTDSNWKKVSSLYLHTIAIKTDGTLWAWGSNSLGQLGDGTTTRQNAPIQIGTDTNWLNISAGLAFTFATKSNFSLWSWGKNGQGQLGNGTSGETNTLIPTRVGTTLDTNDISAGHLHTLEINSDGFLRATGYNADGALGDGTNTQKDTFTTISCPPSLSNPSFISNELKIFPNPVKDILNISFDKEITLVSLYNLLGQEVITSPINANETTIDVSQLTSGTYLLKINSGNSVKTLKVIKN